MVGLFACQLTFFHCHVSHLVTFTLVVLSCSAYKLKLNIKYLLFHCHIQSEIPLSFNGINKVAVAVQRQRVIYTENSGFASPALGSAHFHVSWRSDFIFYQKPLYKSLHQSFFYSFKTILPSESGVTLHHSTILPQILLFRHLTSIFESTNVISRY